MAGAVLMIEPAEAPRVRGRQVADQARAAWLLACDLAGQAVQGGAFLRICATSGGEGSGKVGRGSDVTTTLGRKVGCYLAVTVGNVPQAELARAAGLHRSTVITHCQDVEDMRDDPAVDALLEELGKRMIGAAARLVLASMGEAA